MGSAISLQNISKSFGRQKVLHDVALELKPGTFYVLVGKNGAGKSTLMRILMRYETPDSGSGMILTSSIEDDDEVLNSKVGYVSESLEFAIPIRIKDFFRQYSRIYPQWSQNLFDSTLEELSISQQRRFKELSRGQKMQVAFAAALAIQPKILLLDEITAVLDASARSYFMDRLAKFTRSGGCVVMATNIVAEVQSFASHMILLHDGRVSLDLPFSEISKSFLKIRRINQDPHPIFSDRDCVEVGSNSDLSVSYVLHRSVLEKYQIDLTSSPLLDRRDTTAEEIFIYFTRMKSK